MDILKSVFRLTPQAFITDAIIDALMELVGDVLSWLGDFFGIGSDETQTAARIYMVDTTGWDQVLDYVEVLQNPFSACVYTSRACVISPVGYTLPGQSANLKLGENAYGPFDVAVDMVINEGRSREDSRGIDIPGGDATVSAGDIKLNRCYDPTDGEYEGDTDEYANYRTIVHETGHALGMSGFSTRFSGLPDYETAHPTIVTSTMNYDSEVSKTITGWRESDCSPHPWDILAIHALYQVDIP